MTRTAGARAFAGATPPGSGRAASSYARMPAVVGRAVARAFVHALGVWPPARAVQVRDDDVFIVSYPKSGSTWMRFLLANLLAADAVDFGNLRRIIPDIHQSTANQLDAQPAPRILKSHEYLDPRYRRMIYLVRDPRDVAISYYHHHVRVRAIPEDFPLGRFVERFVEGRLDPYGSWGHHVGGWLGGREGDPGFLLIRYEDLSADTARELARTVAFLGLPASKDELAGAIANSSFEAMRALERNEAQSAGSSRAERPFVRSGTTGGWRRDLPPALAAQIAAAWGATMSRLGYAPD
jgi:hypothetical protein